MKYNIVIATQGIPFHGDTDREKALGGSETAVINVARELVAIGHNVRVFCNCPKEGMYDGVLYLDYNKNFGAFITHDECDICIVSRFHQILGVHKINSKLNILWNHDILVDKSAFLSSLWAYDYTYCLSKFHREQYINEIPELDSEFTKLLMNGVDESLVGAPYQNTRHRIMFTSRPERGLYKALQIYEKYNDKTLELLICTYASIKDPAVEQEEKVCAAKIQQLRADGFKIEVDSFTKAKLYQKIGNSKAVLYPTEFPEIFCISAIEAQACGTPFITADNFALKEVVPYFRCSTDEEYNNMLKKVLTDKEHNDKLIAEGYKSSAKYTWKKVANLLLADLDVYFEKRSSDTEGIIKRFFYDSDLVRASQFSHLTGNTVEKRIYKSLVRLSNPKEVDEMYEDETNFDINKFEELEKVPRLAWPSHQVEKFGCESLLSIGCHNGAAEIMISNSNPNCFVTGYDISKKIIKQARKMKKAHAKEPGHIRFIDSTDEIAKVQYASIFLGEVLEHVLDPHLFITYMEEYVKPGGKVFITLPRGAWEWLSNDTALKTGINYHMHSFDDNDIEAMFGEHKDFMLERYYGGANVGYYQEPIGNYLISYTKDDSNVMGHLPTEYKAYIARPYQSISACIIARDATNTIEKLLDSINFEMDEIVIGVDHDEGTCDEFLKRIQRYPKVKWFYISKRIVADELGFAAARNETVAQATSKWIFWIDTDEELLKMHRFRKYLDTPYFNAFNIRQQHPQIDGFLPADAPQRLFRKGTGNFVGYIHEQVQSLDDINQAIVPSVVLADCHILNFGETHELLRRTKAMNRNLSLLTVDVRENVDNRRKDGKPIRYLSIILLMRDYTNRIIYAIEKYRDPKIDDIQVHSQPKIEELYTRFFRTIPDEIDSYFKNLAYELLQKSRELAKIGTPVEIKVGDKKYLRQVTNDELAALEDVLRTI